MTLKVFSPLLAIFFVIGFLASAEAQQLAKFQEAINAPLGQNQMISVLKDAPILIQPKCTLGRDNPCPVDFVQKGNFDTSKIVGKDSSKAPATVYFDYIELGGFVGKLFMFYRVSDNGIGHPHDTESDAIVQKKSEIGSSYENPAVLEKLKLVASSGNAHGLPVTLVGSPEYKNEYPDLTLQKIFERTVSPDFLEQARKNDRIVDMKLGRVAVYSEPGYHSLTPVSSIPDLVTKFNDDRTYIYVPAGDKATIERVGGEFTKVRDANHIIEYQLVEFAPIVLKHQNELFAKQEKNFFGKVSDAYFQKVDDNVTDWAGSQTQLASMYTEFKNKEGYASGANPYTGWTITSLFDAQGKRSVPENYKSNPRIPWIAFDLVVERAFPFSFTEKEKDERALVPVRNPYRQIKLAAEK